MSRKATKKKATRKKKKAKKPAARKKSKRKPRNWDKAVNAAYLRMVGYPRMSQEKAAKQAGVGERTLRTWEAAPFWKDAKAEARDRWFNDGDAGAMGGILEAMENPKESASMSRWWADRHIPELAPPKQRTEVEAKVQVQDLSKWTEEELELAEQLASKVATAAPDSD